MKGLIIKDLLNLKKSSKSLILICILYAVIGFASRDAGFLSGIIVILFSMLAVTSFSYDDISKWDIYALSLPIKRKDIVLSKYLLASLLTFLGSVLSLLFAIFIAFVKKFPLSVEQFAISGALFAVVLIFISILLPLIFKFGVEKSRIMMVSIFLIPTIIVLILNKLNISMPTENQLLSIFKFSPIIVIAILIISFTVSCMIFDKKEL